MARSKKVTTETTPTATANLYNITVNGETTQAEITPISDGTTPFDSKFTGEQIDNTINIVKDNKTKWDGKVDPDDERLTNARPPLQHEHNPDDITDGLIVNSDTVTAERNPETGAYTLDAIIPTTAAELLYFGIENGIPVASHSEPTEPQVIMSMRSIPANPGVWHDIITFTLSENLKGTEFEFIPDNTFKSVFWARSNLARSGALFRLRAANILTGESLALGTASVNLGQQGDLQPIIIQGIYGIPAIVLAENIRMILQVQSPLFEIQIGLFSIPPNEKSYIARLISGTLPTVLNTMLEWFNNNILPTFNDDKLYILRNGQLIEITGGAIWTGPINGSGENGTVNTP